MKLIYKYRIYPNLRHRVFLDQQFGCNRFIWNHFVELRNKTGYYMSYNDMANYLVTTLKPDHPWLEDVNSQSLQQLLMDFAKSVKMIGGGKGHPNFKKKSWRQSARFPQRVRVERNDNLLFLPKLTKHPIRIVLHRPLPEYTMCTIVKEADDTYYACFYVEREIPEVSPPDSVSHLGLDLGLKDLIVTSDGERIAHPKFYKKTEQKISQKNKVLARMKRGSRRWLKVKKRLSKDHSKVKRQRMDFVHKLTHELASRDSVQGISVESLKIQNMMKSGHLAKSISDASWTLIVTTLKYKLTMRNKSFISCGGLFPSTQLCSKCEMQTGPKTLETRVWDCPVCSAHHDRDINAAMNIAREGNRLYIPRRAA